MDGSKNKNIPRKTKGNYCFPNFLGKIMASVGQRVQFESSLLGISFILIGIVVMTIVTIFGMELSLFIKIMAGVNGTAALLFLTSHLITTFQQYQAYLSIMGILETDNKKLEPKKIESEELESEELNPKKT